MAWESLHGGPSENMMDLKMLEIPEEQDIYQGEFLRITDDIYLVYTYTVLPSTKTGKGRTA